MKVSQRPEWDGVDADLYDQFAPGLAGDVLLYVDEAVKAGSPVLKLGCGTGRTQIPIAQAGVDIVGLDRAQRMLELVSAKVAGLSQSTRNHIELAQGDMRSFALHRQFNLVTIPYRAFTHLVTPEDQMQALHRVREHLFDGVI